MSYLRLNKSKLFAILTFCFYTSWRRVWTRQLQFNAKLFAVSIAALSFERNTSRSQHVQVKEFGVGGKGAIPPWAKWLYFIIFGGLAALNLIFSVISVKIQ